MCEGGRCWPACRHGDSLFSFTGPLYPFRWGTKQEIMEIKPVNNFWARPRSMECRQLRSSIIVGTSHYRFIWVKKPRVVTWGFLKALSGLESSPSLTIFTFEAREIHSEYLETYQALECSLECVGSKSDYGGFVKSYTT